MLKYLKRKHGSGEEDSDDESQIPQPSTSKGKVSDVKKNRLYNDSYLAIGFTWTGEEKCPLPLGIVCGKKLANTAMVPAKLKRHFNTNHSHLSNKTVDYFRRLLDSQQKLRKVFKRKVTISDKAQEASYLVAELVAKKMKSHTIAESFIMPACKIIVRTMLGEEAECEVSKVPVSDNTINTRVDDLSNNISGILSEILQNNNFALQVDETTDITGKAQLLAFVRFENEGEIIENFLCCKELPETTKGHDIFNILSSNLESYNLSWNQCVGICTDGAPSMIGSVQGFVSRVKEKNSEVITTHCFLHREVLVSKIIGNDLKQVLDITVNMVNFIKQRPLKSRMFARLCENMQKDHVTLLLHTEARWLSRGKVLSRVFELRQELLLFFKENNKASFCECLESTNWQMKLAYLADIYQHLNNLNTSMQGAKENILTSTDKLLAFKNKLSVWKKHLSRGNVEMFPLLLQVQTQTKYEYVIPLITSHLGSLSEKLHKYFPSLSSDMYDWVRNPFTEFSPSTENLLSLQEEEELSELQCDRTLKMKFNEVLLDKFWISAKREYPVISVKALNVLLQFSTSYLCEQAFSCLTIIKSKSRNRLLSVEEKLRVCLSKIRPRISQIRREKQAQVSH